MRTDVKIGIAIGLVVVGLLVVWVVLYRGGDEAQPPAGTPEQTGKTAQTPGGPRPAPTRPPAPLPGPLATMPAPTPAPPPGPLATLPAPTPAPLPGGGLAGRPPTPAPSPWPWMNTGTTTRPAPVAGGEQIHTVAANETLWGIAQAKYGDGQYSTLIIKANPDVNPSRLRIGQKLKLPPKPQAVAGAPGAGTPGPGTAGGAAPVAGPGQKVYSVVAGDTGWGIAQREYGNGAYWTAIAKANRGVDASRLKIGQKLVLPSRSEVEASPGNARSATPPPPVGGAAGVGTASTSRTERPGTGTPVRSGPVPGRPFFGGT